MGSLDFIKDAKLRETLEDSIEYMYALYEDSKSSGVKKRYQEETYRVIILYVVSAIEAVLLYFYKVRGEKMISLEYKFVQALPAGYFHGSKRGCPVVVAVQDLVEKREQQLGLHELVIFFKEKKLMREETAEGILDMNDVRNTFHFNKSRSKTCDLDRVEKALQLLVHTIENAPKTLAKR